MINPENNNDQQAITNPPEEFLSYSEHMRQITESSNDSNKPATEIITYNSALERNSNEPLQTKINTLLREEIDYISNTFDIASLVIQANCPRLSIMNWKPGQKSYILFGKEKIEQHDHGAMWAFYSPMFQVNADTMDNEWNVDKTIHCSEKTSDHDLSHELLHALSSSPEINFDENGVASYKSGLSIKSINKQRQVVDKSHDAIGLTEGLTELLAERIEPPKSPQYTYAQAKRIANILLSPFNNELAQAYFSTKSEDIKNFFRDFDDRQNSISSKELINLDPEAKFITTSLLKGCVEYTLSFCENPKQQQIEKERLQPIVKEILRKNWNAPNGIGDYIKAKRQFRNNPNIESLNIKLQSLQSLNTELTNIPESVTNYDSYESYILEIIGF